MEVLFDQRNEPSGAVITNYLLEKGRVVTQTPGERNFHIFYQLCSGCNDEERDAFCLYDPTSYFYLNQGGQNALYVDGVDDAQEFQETKVKTH